MKTVKLTSAIVALSMVIFMSVASIANSNVLITGNLSGSGDKSLNISNTSEKDLSYLRFDVSKYNIENEETNMVHGTMDYLRFDVNNYISSTESEAMELPVTNEFDYLRFDVNNYTESSPVTLTELPETGFNYLRFDLNNYVSESPVFVDELPVTE
jgi:hypothetical protein